MKRYQIENTFSGHALGIYEGETPEEAIQAMMDDAGCSDAPDPELKAREVHSPTRLMLRTLSRCPGNPSEWQWTEAVDADAPDDATVEEYVEVHDDATSGTHAGVFLVRDMGEAEMERLGIEDIRGRIHRECGALVAWVSKDGTVSYELVAEE